MAVRSIWEIQKFQRILRDIRYLCIFFGASYTYANFSIRAHVPMAATSYSGYAAGTELLADVGKLYKQALGNVFEEEDWGVLEFTVMGKHFDRQGQAPYAYHAHYMAHILSHGDVDGTRPTAA